MDISKLMTEFKQKLTVQRYAYSTIKTYANCLGKFLQVFQKYELENVEKKNSENYIAHLITTRNVSASYQKKMLGTIDV